MQRETRLRPLVIAHRGASLAAPENTIAAFALARALGADMVELDARRTIDGVVVVNHDPRVGGEDGPVIAEITAAELPPAVPTLVTALEACAPMGVNVEVKMLPHEPDYDATYAVAGDIARAIEAAGAEERVLVSSFDPAMAAAVHDFGFATAQLLLGSADFEAIAALGHVAVNPFDSIVTLELVRAAHDEGLAVHVWTVDDPDRMRELESWGVDGIMTNQPDVAVAALRGIRA